MNIDNGGETSQSPEMRRGNNEIATRMASLLTVNHLKHPEDIPDRVDISSRGIIYTLSRDMGPLAIETRRKFKLPETEAPIYVLDRQTAEGNPMPIGLEGLADGRGVAEYFTNGLGTTIYEAENRLAFTLDGDGKVFISVHELQDTGDIEYHLEDMQLMAVLGTIPTGERVKDVNAFDQMAAVKFLEEAEQLYR